MKDNLSISELIDRTNSVITSCTNIQQVEVAIRYSSLVVTHIQNNNCSLPTINSIVAYFKSKTDDKYLELLARGMK
jgi:hypothetical protein